MEKLAAVKQAVSLPSSSWCNHICPLLLTSVLRLHHPDDILMNYQPLKQRSEDIGAPVGRLVITGLFVFLHGAFCPHIFSISSNTAAAIRCKLLSGLEKSATYCLPLVFLRVFCLWCAQDATHSPANGFTPV